MELLVTKAGLTPLEAISAATGNGARVLGIADSYRTITPGRIADAVVLTADPRPDIRNTTTIAYVINGGIPHKHRGRSKDMGDPGEIRELKNLVRIWDEATVKGDAATVDRLLADEFAFVGGPRKAQYLQSIKSKSIETLVESAVSDELQVQVYGDTAVIIGVDTVKVKNRSQPYENRFLYMDVWIKRSGRWQCVKAYSTLSK